MSTAPETNYNTGQLDPQPNVTHQLPLTGSGMIVVVIQSQENGIEVVGGFTDDVAADTWVDAVAAAAQDPNITYLITRVSGIFSPDQMAW